MARDGSVGLAEYEKVDALAETGMTKAAAIKAVAEELGKTPASVQNNYYRIARVKTGGRRKSASRAPRTAHGRPCPTRCTRGAGGSIDRRDHARSGGQHRAADRRGASPERRSRRAARPTRSRTPATEVRPDTTGAERRPSGKFRRNPQRFRANAGSRLRRSSSCRPLPIRSVAEDRAAGEAARSELPRRRLRLTGSDSSVACPRPFGVRGIVELRSGGWRLQRWLPQRRLLRCHRAFHPLDGQSGRSGCPAVLDGACEAGAAEAGQLSHSAGAGRWEGRSVPCAGGRTRPAHPVGGCSVRLVRTSHQPALPERPLPIPLLSVV